jgi:hypothetical protein
LWGFGAGGPLPSAWKAWLESASVLVFYPAVVLLCLRQWASPAPWSRLDLFSGGYLVLSLALLAQQAVFAVRIAGSQEIRTAFYSLEIDPEFSRWSTILGLLETQAFLDYAHWHLRPPPPLHRLVLHQAVVCPDARQSHRLVSLHIVVAADRAENPQRGALPAGEVRIRL